jgi:hypothetical protein
VEMVSLLAVHLWFLLIPLILTFSISISWKCHSFLSLTHRHQGPKETLKIISNLSPVFVFQGFNIKLPQMWQLKKNKKIILSKFWR